ncbi:hypothetical protein JAAARDRAFT_57368 [Jaapia argillacea MUCL 33604]|uniref:F-box domain-containing protein n=1 Tax=Jaapia argillacea MUCL 33604 TaxID=933084 RepID=A0A067PUQ5_9AGAM|nr:hypothetical protein JAAARDRAFT_57368 [Jaapia argillacea MUCL 33604]
MNPLLPQEVIDQVIDHLHDDPTALSSCSLTCRAWTPSSQLHIFHSVTLEPTLVQPLSHLLQTSPHIARYIISLKLSPATHHGAQGPYAYISLNIGIPAIVPRLSNVRKLELELLRSRFLEDTAFRALSEAFPHLRIIVARRCQIVGLDDWFTNLICTHPDVIKLEMLDCAFGQIDHFRRIDISPLLGVTAFPNISSLTWDSPSWIDTPGIQSLLSHHTLSRLEMLDISVTNLVMISDLANVISTAARSLKALTLRFNHLVVKCATVQALENVLQHCSALRVLSIDTVPHLFNSPHQRKWLEVILHALPASRLEEFYFRFITVGRLEYENRDWDAIFEILSLAKFDSLRKIQLAPRDRTDAPSEPEELRRKASRLGERVKFLPYG